MVGREFRFFAGAWHDSLAAFHSKLEHSPSSSNLCGLSDSHVFVSPYHLQVAHSLNIPTALIKARITDMSGQSLRDQIMDALGQLEDEQIQKVLDMLHALRSKQDVLLLDETDRRLLQAMPSAGADAWRNVIADYLNERINLGRAAELLGVPLLDLQSRFRKLGIPLRWGAQTIEEARREVEVAAALSMSKKRQPVVNLGL